MIHPNLRDPAGRVRAGFVVYWLLAAVLSLLPAALILGTRSAAGLMLGLSGLRLGMAAVFLASGLIFLALAADDLRRPAASTTRRERVLALLDRRFVWSGLTAAAAAAGFAAAVFITLLPDLRAGAGAAIAERLLPAVVWVGGLGALTLAALVALHHGKAAAGLLPRGRLFYSVLLIDGLIFFIWGWVARNILPGEAQRLGWNHLGAALIGSQVLLVWVASTALTALMGRSAAKEHPAAKGAAPRRALRLPVDLGLAALIWAAAVLVWSTAPVTPNWFLTRPVHPNFEYYPSSDARAYDVSAQTALIGEGYTFYDQPYIRRSLLALYLTGLHLLAGQDYGRLIGLQIMVLALIPVCLFGIARRLHGRFAGLLLAGLVILREGNAIRLSADITTSNAKLIMADLPATLMAAAVFLMALHWLEALRAAAADDAASGRARLAALLCGGALGFSMLVRLETFTFFAALAVAGGGVLWRERVRPPRARFGLWLQSGLLALIGVLMVISPWVYRNYDRTGKIFIDHPYFQIGLLLQRFHPEQEALRPQRQTPTAPVRTARPPTAAPTAAAKTPTANPPAQTPIPGGAAAPTQPTQPTRPQPAQTQPAAAAGRAPLPSPTPTSVYTERFLESEAGTTIEFIGSNLGELSRLALAHILNSQIQTFLILPSAPLGMESAVNAIGHRSASKAWSECCTPQSAVRKLPYWRAWNGLFPTRSTIPLLLTLTMIAYGLHIAWKRSGWAGLAPMLIAVTYITFNGVLRNSGGRYILPVDWTALLYFSLGLAQFTRNLAGDLVGAAAGEALEDRAPAPLPNLAPTANRPRIGTAARLALAALGLLALGSVIPLVETAFPRRYDREASDAMFQKLLQSEQLDQAQRRDLQEYLQNGAFALTGRGLYPRFFPSGVGDDVARRNPFAPRPYPRMAFFLIGRVNQSMALPVEAKPPEFPNGVDLLAIVCPEREILALALFNPDGGLNKVYLRFPFPEPPHRCPPPEPPAASK